jgi:hypothetical protein
MQELLELGFSLSAPIIDGQQRIEAQDGTVGPLRNIGAEGRSVEVPVIHLHGVLPEQEFSVAEGARCTAPGRHKKQEEKKYVFLSIHSYKNNIFSLYLHTFILDLTLIL